MNASWHRKHPMSTRPTLEQRVRWHAAHAKACGCRKMPASIAKKLRKQRSRAR